MFAFELLTDLSSFYPIRSALLVVKLALQVYATLLRGRMTPGAFDLSSTSLFQSYRPTIVFVSSRAPTNSSRT